jgi:hypothetical protein
MYESEFTVFLREMKQARPNLEEEQRTGRAIWWDRPQDLETQRRDRESKLPQPAYAYFSSVK